MQFLRESLAEVAVLVGTLFTNLFKNKLFRQTKSYWQRGKNNLINKKYTRNAQRNWGKLAQRPLFLLPHLKDN